MVRERCPGSGVWCLEMPADRSQNTERLNKATIKRTDSGPGGDGLRKLLQLALLKPFLLAVVCLVAVPAHGHYMGRTVPIGYAGNGPVHLVAQVIASYFEEQMGRETELSVESSVEECIQTIIKKEAPMAVVSLGVNDGVPDGIVRVTPGLNAVDVTITLIMGADARRDLQYSLVPKYMENLNRLIEQEAWIKALNRVKNGEGVRKVALDMLREADLL